MIYCYCVGQKVDTSLIILWSENRKLNVGDFKVVPDNSSILKPRVSALTRTGITYYLSYSTSAKGIVKVQINIQSTVHKAHIYIKERMLHLPAARLAYLINHEQKHFDISEIFAREAAMDLSMMKLTRNYRKEIAAFVTKKFKEAENDQQLYDRETTNGENDEAQAEWNDRITKRLNELDAYKKKRVVRTIRR